jgi:outer membrane immunogenic protein
VGAHSVTESTVAGNTLIIVPAGTALYGGPQAYDLAPRGIIGGGQIGYNWQFNPAWVVGLESDFQGADLDRTKNCVIVCNTAVAIVNTAAGRAFPVRFTANSYTNKLDWFGTVRGRWGFTTGPTLFYVTGGLAYGDVQRSGAVTGSTTGVVFGNNTFAGTFSNSSVRTGWTVGGGVEAKLMGNWTMKGEYLYVDLGTVTDSFNTTFLTSTFGGQVGTTAATRTISSEITDHIFRVGLNYKFM